MMDERRIIAKDAKEELLKFLNENLLISLPLEIQRGFNEYIRITKTDYEKLPKDIKKVLDDYANPPFDDHNVYAKDPEAKKLYEETHYWKNCNAYLFAYTLNRSFVLLAGCKYGFEGLEDKKEKIWFLYEDELPRIILDNLGCLENREPGFRLI